MTCGLATALEPPHFNPRTRVGCDGQLVLSISQRLFVSIHAPAWGATPRPLTGFLRHESFNPRTLVGCDWRPCWAFPSASRFQSTHPRGVRLSGYVQAVGEIEFQSTHPRGVRRRPTGAIPRQVRFQSTHPRGVRRRKCFMGVSSFRSFNPRTRVGCDLALEIPSGYWGGFNPRTRVGCDGRDHQRRGRGARRFNPRTRVGCDQFQGQQLLGRGLFQSTHPRGVRRYVTKKYVKRCDSFNPRTRVGCDSFHVLSSRFP